MDPFTNINMNLLKTFAVASEVLSFTQAAEILYMTQSGVSQHIAKLEKSLNCKLFHRSGKKLVLSQSGEHLLRFVSNMQINFQSTVETIAAEQEELQGRVYIGMPGSINNALRGYLLSENRETIKSVQLGIILGPDKHIFDMLRDNVIDIGFTTTPISSKHLPCCQVFKEEIALIAAAGFPPIRSLKELQRSKFVMHPGFDEYWKHWFGEVFPNTPYYYPEKISAFMNNFENILYSVAEGFGVTVLPIRDNMELLKNKRIIKSTPHEKIVEQSVFLVHKPTASFAAKTVGKMCVTYLKNSVQNESC